MQIRQLRVAIRPRDFALSCRFYGEILRLPRLRSYQTETARGAEYQAGEGVVELVGGVVDPARTRAGEPPRDPSEGMTIQLVVVSAERAYRELLQRDPDLPGGLLRQSDGTVVLQTHDPDGVTILIEEAEPE